MLLRKTFRFEASHVLPKHPGKCSRLHGHSWVLHIEVQGQVNPETGFVMDYSDIGRYGKAVVDALDHRHLGTWEGMTDFCNQVWRVPDIFDLPKDFYPSSENLLWQIGRRIAPVEKPYTASSEINIYWMGINWSKLALEETCTSYAELTREEFNAAHNKS